VSRALTYSTPHHVRFRLYRVASACSHDLGIEVLIVQLGVHLAQKVGEKWIDRIGYLPSSGSLLTRSCMLLQQNSDDEVSDKHNDVKDTNPSNDHYVPALNSNVTSF
jgi:hypothetical protein